jgi:hypothetical protein
MNRYFLLLAMIIWNSCYAGTGNARDGDLFIFSLVIIMILPLAISYYIDFMKNRIKDNNTWFTHHLHFPF